MEQSRGTVLVLLGSSLRREHAAWLDEAGYQVLSLTDPQEALETLDARLDVDVVAADALSSERMLVAAQAAPQGLEVVLVGPEDVVLVTQAMAAGAHSYLSDPLSEGDLLEHVARAIYASREAQLSEDRRRQLPAEVQFEGIVGTTPRMQEVMQTLRRAAPTDAPVMILGETGTGKELVARAIHENSKRARGNFVALHLLSTPAGLVESELFGHKKGAFTGAHSDREGKLEQANGGTLFLDELGDIPLETQTKLLRVLETQTFEPVGSNKSVRSDFRVIAATNQDIEGMIRDKRFREELWHRLNVITVSLPPLRERRADIPLLVDRFAKEFATRYGKPYEGVTPEALAALQRFDWPGNIRGLRNKVQHMVVLADSPRLSLRDVPREVRGAELPEPEAAGASLAGRSMEDIERDAIAATLELVGGNRKQAADMLEIGERTLYRKIEKYGL
ncbi:MAG: sigma-54-dependent Fis family transcriptional regulator [Planctomycetes bacterium]|nr:sigma-54-dependent Fis family transcriptional regulator [Planctomycetota bacterium]